jgi:pimeloyl-ACP methyl ester carboxylesterase
VVPRPRLIQRLNEGVRSGRKLTLVSAPAGFGKTTLVSEWIAAIPNQVAWLSMTVLVFRGEEDTLLHPKISEYVCMRIPSCDEPTIYPGEGHSAVYYRYEEIIQAMLAAWE